jgi:hypothetical protein
MEQPARSIGGHIRAAEYHSNKSLERLTDARVHTANFAHDVCRKPDRITPDGAT